MGIKQLYNDNLRKLPNEYGDVSVMCPGRNHMCARSDSLCYYSDRTFCRSSKYTAETEVAIGCLIVSPERIAVV